MSGNTIARSGRVLLYETNWRGFQLRVKTLPEKHPVFSLAIENSLSGATTALILVKIIDEALKTRDSRTWHENEIKSLYGKAFELVLFWDNPESETPFLIRFGENRDFWLRRIELLLIRNLLVEHFCLPL